MIHPLLCGVRVLRKKCAGVLYGKSYFLEFPCRPVLDNYKDRLSYVGHCQQKIKIDYEIGTTWANPYRPAPSLVAEARREQKKNGANSEMAERWSR